MGRPATAGRSHRGGASIPPLRTRDLRLAAAGGAAVLAGGLAAYPVLDAGRIAPLLGVLAAAGLLCVVLSVVARGRFTGAALFLLASEYAIAEAAGRVPAVSVMGYAAGLIIVSELLLWVAHLPRSASADRAVATGQLMTLAGITVAAVLLALAVLAAAGLRLSGALDAALLGTAAAVALLILPWQLLRRAGHLGPPADSTGPAGTGQPAADGRVAGDRDAPSAGSGVCG